jgi:hypothetical protein
MSNIRRTPTAAVLSVAVMLAASMFAASAVASSSASCKGISFTVLHNDHSGGVTLPHGQYNITSPNLSCSAASNYFKTFLDKYNGKIPGWTGKQFKPGYGKYSKNKSKLNFTVKLTKLGTTASCKGISFTVLHNDHSGGVALPAGQYNITSPNLSCSAASNYFKTFLDKYNGKIPGWTGKQFKPGYGKYSKNKSKLNFTVKLTKPKK